ncbi:MAG: polysulfide reductase [Phycisphaerales bacterium]|nr:polysulfide reductase [Phycisphaerales bacterium]
MPGVDTHLDRQPAGPQAPSVHDYKSPTGEPSYYDVSFLQPPVWKWEIAAYFFLGGVAAGAYVIGRTAERFGGRKYSALTKAATYTSFAALLPSPPLLIHDLGDPRRFHHMLRVWKPQTPMNLGSWVLTGFGAAASAAVLREYLKTASPEERSVTSKIVDGTLLLISDAAGVPLALMLGGYTGVLLSCTANPIWCRNTWLGPLFMSSAIGTGAMATSLVLSAMGETSPDDESLRALDTIDTVSNLGEAVFLGAYLRSLGRNAYPLTRGKWSPHIWGGVAGLAASEILKYLPLRGRAKRWANIGSALSGLAAGFSLRWALVHAGKDAANDPATARRSSRPKRPEFAPENARPAISQSATRTDLLGGTFR